MKYIIYFLLLMFYFSFAQDIEWSKTIPLSTEENGVKQIDTDDEGNIYIAGWYGGPNSAEWDWDTDDSLIYSPEITLLKLNSSGELVLNKDYGKLFHRIIGFTTYYGGFKLTGNNWSGFNPMTYQFYSFATLDNSHDVTHIYNSSTSYPENDYSLSINSTEDDGYLFISYLRAHGYTNTSLQRVSPDSYLNNSFPSSYSLPDTLASSDYTENSIVSADITKENGVILTGAFYDFSEGYSNIIQLTDSFEVSWQLFYPNVYTNLPNEIGRYFKSIESLTDSTCLVTYWADINNSDDVDNDEYFLEIINKHGEIIWQYLSFDEPIIVEGMSDNDFLVRGLTTNTIWKFRFNGTGMDLLWTQVYSDLGTFKVEPYGFISASIVNDELYIFKVKDDTSIDDQPSIPKTSQLYYNYPNPFNPVTTLSYSLSEKGYIELVVYNTKGEIVSELVNKEQNVGLYNIKFDGNNINSGVYFYQLKLNNTPIDTKRMLLIK